MAKVETSRLDKVCPNCGFNLSLKTKRGVFSKKTWIECEGCGRVWNTEDELNHELMLAKDAKELEYVQQTGILPELYLIGSKLILKKHETLHLHEYPVELLEEKTKTYSYRSKSIGVRVKVTKGVYLTPRVGGGTIKVNESSIESIDNGELYLTSKRLVFIGEKKTLNIQLKKILVVEEYSDAIKIGREGKQKAEYFKVLNPRKWKLYIQIAISNLEK